MTKSPNAKMWKYQDPAKSKWRNANMLKRCSCGSSTWHLLGCTRFFLILRCPSVDNIFICCVWCRQFLRRQFFLLFAINYVWHVPAITRSRKHLNQQIWKIPKALDELQRFAVSKHDLKPSGTLFRTNSCDLGLTEDGHNPAACLPQWYRQIIDQ